MTPGIYAMPATDYHADCCPAPSLSASVAHILLTQSAAHARHAHPRLNPAVEPEEPTPAMEEGTLLHARILEQQHIDQVIKAPNYRSGGAQRSRDEARAAGKIPVLAHRWEAIRGTATAVRAQLARHEARDAFTAGKPEQVMVWEERTRSGPIWCRARVDWMQDDPAGWLDDLKTVGGSAEPYAWSKTLLREGRALQAAFYLRGARALGRTPKGFRFVVVERDAPHGLAVVAPGPEVMDLGEQQAQTAIDLWAHHLRDDFWPAYPTRICWAEAPGWASFEWEERKIIREQAGVSQARVMAQTGMPAA